MTTTALRSLDGLAIAGHRARAASNELFVGATLTDDLLVITYKSTSRQRSGRSWVRIDMMRLVTCERSWHDGDFRWVPVKQQAIELSRTKCAPSDRHDWFVPAGKAIVR